MTLNPLSDTAIPTPTRLASAVRVPAASPSLMSAPPTPTIAAPPSIETAMPSIESAVAIARPSAPTSAFASGLSIPMQQLSCANAPALVIGEYATCFVVLLQSQDKLPLSSGLVGRRFAYFR